MLVTFIMFLLHRAPGLGPNRGATRGTRWLECMEPGRRRPAPTEGSRTQGEGLRTSRPQPLPLIVARYATVTSRVAMLVLPQLSVTVTVMV